VGGLTKICCQRRNIYYYTGTCRWPVHYTACIRKLEFGEVCGMCGVLFSFSFFFFKRAFTLTSYTNVNMYITIQNIICIYIISMHYNIIIYIYINLLHCSLWPISFFPYFIVRKHVGEHYTFIILFILSTAINIRSSMFNESVYLKTFGKNNSFLKLYNIISITHRSYYYNTR